MAKDGLLGAVCFAHWARVALQARQARTEEHFKVKCQRLQEARGRLARRGHRVAELLLEVPREQIRQKVFQCWQDSSRRRTRHARMSAQLARVQALVDRWHTRDQQNHGGLCFLAWRNLWEMGRGQRCVEMWRVAQRQGAQQVLICHVARRSHLLAQRAVLLWWHVTMESFQDRQRCRWDHLLCLKCLQAWRHRVQLRVSTAEQQEMLELIESSNTWIQVMRQERWDHEEQMALAVCQLNELQEALVLEAKSKETFTRQIQELQDQLAAERRSSYFGIESPRPCSICGELGCRFATGETGFEFGRINQA
ncbi:unnamed protein product [Durusdinium trenchii]|uniref:Uncharacterized protein n=1 Tax=Durusdinium trenchii TaxID=1381693 RepID=A0ABP0NWM5_9DINO